MTRSSQDGRGEVAARSLLGLALLSTIGCFIAAAWLYSDAVPRTVQAAGDTEIVRKRVMLDAVVGHGLSVALAGGDYGEVQEVMTRYESLGFFTGAAVTNVDNKIVAMVGKLEGMRIGDLMPNQTLRESRGIDLELGAGQLGKLLILAERVPPVGSADNGKATRRGAPILMAALAVLSAGIFIWLWWQMRERFNALRLISDDPNEAAKPLRLPGGPVPPTPTGAWAALFGLGLHLRRRTSDLHEFPPSPSLKMQGLPDTSVATELRQRSAPAIDNAAQRRAGIHPLTPNNAGTLVRKPDDAGLAAIIQANRLTMSGQKDEAIRQLVIAAQSCIEDPNLQYNIGLSYFDAENFEKLLDFAHRAYRNGITLGGLKNKLVAAGEWRDPPSIPADIDQDTVTESRNNSTIQSKRSRGALRTLA